MKLTIVHRTTFRYSDPARDSVNEVRICPRDRPEQTCEFFLLKVLPAVRLHRYPDLFRNQVHHFQISTPHTRMVVEARSTVTTRDAVDYESLPYGVRHSALEAGRLSEECHEFLQDSTYVKRSPAVWREALDIRDHSEDVFQTVYATMAAVHSTCRYVPGVTDSSTGVEDFLSHRQGVCQDFAHLMIAYCRALGIPARYVSGYLFDPLRHGGGAMRGSQASHAWVEAYLPGHGWVGFDPTNNKVVNAQYVVLAVGRDYDDVTPVRGSFYGGGHHRAMEVQVDVRPHGAEG